MLFLCSAYFCLNIINILIQKWVTDWRGAKWHKYVDKLQFSLTARDVDKMLQQHLSLIVHTVSPRIVAALYQAPESLRIII